MGLIHISTLSRWTADCGLGVNLEKTQLVLFTRKYKIPNITLPKLHKSRLTISNQTKYILAKSWASTTALRLREAAAWTTGSTGHFSILTNQISDYYRLRSTHSQLRKKVQDLYTYPYRMA